MILADTFQISNEQKLAFATTAFQAEYGDSISNESFQADFLVEYYASPDFINEVRRFVACFFLSSKNQSMLICSGEHNDYDKKSSKDKDFMRN